jgi:hypothetical protein
MRWGQRIESARRLFLVLICRVNVVATNEPEASIGILDDSLTSTRAKMTRYLVLLTVTCR